MRAQLAAFLAQLQTAENLTVYKSDAVPGEGSRARHYVVVYSQTPSEYPETFAATSTTHGFRVALMHIGTSENEVLFDIEKSRGALRRVRLADTATPLRLRDHGPINPDEQTQDPRIYTATDVWSWADSIA